LKTPVRISASYW